MLHSEGTDIARGRLPGDLKKEKKEKMALSLEEGTGKRDLQCEQLFSLPKR